MLTTEEKRELIERTQARRPDYDVRIVATPEFTDGEVQCKRRKSSKPSIIPGWFSVGYCDDLLREYGLREPKTKGEFGGAS